MSAGAGRLRRISRREENGLGGKRARGIEDSILMAN
jgi:hypothetical protein